MKTLKDKKKFGWKSNKSKNHKCKKFGYSFDKYNRKYWRTEIKRIRHKLLKHIPITKETKDISFINGISVSIVEGTDLKFNQMKLKYSDGTNKVMDIFTWNDKIVYTDIF